MNDMIYNTVDALRAGVYDNPKKVVKRLGITYKVVEKNWGARGLWVFGYCENIPDKIPYYLSVCNKMNHFYIIGLRCYIMPPAPPIGDMEALDKWSPIRLSLWESLNIRWILRFFGYAYSK